MNGVLHLAQTGSSIVSPAEYARRYSEARRAAAALDATLRRRLARVYIDAASKAAAVAIDTLERGLSELTSDRWTAIASQLKDAAEALARGTEAAGIGAVQGTSPMLSEINRSYIWSAVVSAGAESVVSKAALSGMSAAINKQVVASLSSRLWSDGYTFSDRVWGPKGVRADWLEDLKNTIATGIAQGRDPVKIARDIQVYAADGKVAMLNRWGNLQRGTSEFAKRLPKNLDWRAVRLVRSELYASLQDAAVLSGEANPGGEGLYDWILSVGREHWNCECEAIAAGNPYKADDLPSYPHPNCMCILRLRLRPRDEFVADLKRWAAGEDVDYLDAWEKKHLAPAV